MNVTVEPVRKLAVGTMVVLDAFDSTFLPAADLPEDGEELDEIYYPDDEDEDDDSESLLEEEEEEEEDGEEDEPEDEETPDPETPEKPVTPDEPAPKQPDVTETRKPKTPAKRGTETRGSRKELEAVKSEVEAIRAELTQAKRDSLIQNAQVPEDLIPMLPQDLETLKTYLASESYKKVVRAIKSATELGASSKQESPGEPPAKKDGSKDKASRAETIAKLGALFTR